MKLVRSTILFFALLIFGQTQAQDIHWTMFDMSPLTLNPAFTGGFEGTFRVGGIYRSQWNSFANGFETPSFYVDAPILMIGKRSWLGVGGMLYNDDAGSLQLNTLATMGSAALHLGLNKKATSVLTIGLQGGFVQRRLDPRDARPGDIIVPGMGTANDMQLNQSADATRLGGGNADEINTDYVNFGAGLMFTSELNKTSDLAIGLSFRHLTTPRNSVLSPQSDDDLPLRFTLHGRFNTDLNEKFILSPAFIFNRMASANEIGLQVLGGYRLDEKKEMTLYLGPGYRMIDNDAIEAILRFDYKQFRVGAAYDFNMSSLSDVSNGRGAFEIAASYIARIYKKPTVKPVIFCPRF